jgi:hypothetical protein
MKKEQAKAASSVAAQASDDMATVSARCACASVSFADSAWSC